MINTTYLVSFTVSKLWPRMIPFEYPNKLYLSRNTMIFLPDAEHRTIVSSFVWKNLRNVMEGRTDRQNRSRYYSGLHCVWVLWVRAPS